MLPAAFSQERDAEQAKVEDDTATFVVAVIIFAIRITTQVGSAIEIAFGI